MTTRARLVLLALVLAALPPAAAEAQVIRVPRQSREPAAWVSGGVAWMSTTGTVADGESGSEWLLGDGLQYAAALEYPIRGGTGVGVVATFARLPLEFRRTTPGAACAGGCDGDVSTYSLQGLLHVGGGSGFHQVIELAVGVTGYYDFTVDGADAPGAPEHDTDLSFGIGYGFGYALSPRLHVLVIQTLTQVVHEREGLPARADRTIGQYATRFAVRYGIGSRRIY